MGWTWMPTLPLLTCTARGEPTWLRPAADIIHGDVER